MAGPVIVKDLALANQCMEFCQALMTKEASFSFSLSLGPSFCFSLDTKDVSSLPCKKSSSPGPLGFRKKKSPSSLKRNARRRQEFLHKKTLENPGSSKEVAEEAAKIADTMPLEVQSTFVCEICKFGTNAEEVFVQHKQEKHRIFECNVCEFKASSLNGLTTHEIKNHKISTDVNVSETPIKDDSWKCMACHQHNDDMMLWIEHMGKKHRAFHCRFCVFGKPKEWGSFGPISHANSKLRNEHEESHANRLKDRGLLDTPPGPTFMAKYTRLKDYFLSKT